jgi:carbon-monoxide dehydrogenase medium subunit
VKPPRFDYHAPRTLAEAIDLVARHQGAARVLAGGQSLVPMLNFRLAQPDALVDLRLVQDLAGITLDHGVVRIGSMTRQRQAEHSPVVAEHLPLMHAALQWVGHAPTRSRGTIGGSIAHADPSAELPMVLLALDGEVVAAGPSGTRTVPAADLFRSIFTTSLAHDEILTEIRMPRMPAGCSCAVEEFARRPGDFAIVAVAVVLEPLADGACKARIAVAGATETVWRATRAERLLGQSALTPQTIEAAASLASEDCTPMSDPRISGDYRRHLVQVLVRRALLKSAASAPGPWRAH